MAASHAKVLEMSCSKCKRDPSLKEFWGCEKPSQEVVKAMRDDYGNPVYYHSCPNKFISPSVNDFVERYHAIKDGFAVGLTYEDTPAKFFEMKNYYEYWLGFYKSKVTKNG